MSGDTSNRLAEVHRISEPKNSSNHYIVQLTDEADKAAHLAWLGGQLSSASKITGDHSIIKAYSGTFDEETLLAIRKSPDVKRIEEVSLVVPRPCVSVEVIWHVQDAELHFDEEED